MCIRDRPEHFSLSCNPDVTLDLLPLLQRRRAAGETVLSVAQVHHDLPYICLLYTSRCV